MFHYTNDIDELEEFHQDEKDPEIREQMAFDDASFMMKQLEDDLARLGDQMVLHSSRCNWQGHGGYALSKARNLFSNLASEGTIHVDIDEENGIVEGTYSSHDVPTGSSIRGIFVDDLLEELEDDEEWDVYSDIYDLFENKKFIKFMKDNGFDI